MTWPGETMDQWKFSMDRMDRAFSPHDFAATGFLGRWPGLGWHRALGALGGGAFAAVLARAGPPPCPRSSETPALRCVSETAQRTVPTLNLNSALCTPYSALSWRVGAGQRVSRSVMECVRAYRRLGLARGGRDIALRCPRRPAKRRAAAMPGKFRNACASETAQRTVPTTASKHTTMPLDIRR
jgi:hypothetical protein